METKEIMGILLMLILLGAVAYFLIFGININLLEPFKGNTSMRMSCENWNCQEPIPVDIAEHCNTLYECEMYCKDIGALMMQCQMR